MHASLPRAVACPSTYEWPYNKPTALRKGISIRVRYMDFEKTLTMPLPSRGQITHRVPVNLTCNLTQIRLLRQKTMSAIKVYVREGLEDRARGGRDSRHDITPDDHAPCLASVEVVPDGFGKVVRAYAG